MYPSLPDTDLDMEGVVTLPDGRVLRIRETGHREGDTNAYVQESLVLIDDETGNELTDDEMNAEITDDAGKTHYLHEYACEFAVWG
jgi:hypothetical protein